MTSETEVLTSVYIKMCGMMDSSDVAACAALGIDAVGIVIEYPVPVPWNLSRHEGRELIAGVPHGVASVVVCSGPPDALADLARDVRPDALQVHGDESLAETEEIVRRVAPFGVEVYRALRIRPETGRASGEIAEVEEAARAVERTGVAGLVVDSKVASRPGGTGIPVNVALMGRVVDAVSIPVIAAGGLGPHNVADVIRAVRPFGVDVLSGIEEAPGTKSRAKMEAFANAVRTVVGDGASAGGPGERGVNTGV